MDPRTKLGNQTGASISGAEIEMAKYGITCRTVNWFHYKSFKYTNFNNALSQDKR